MPIPDARRPDQQGTAEQVHRSPWSPFRHRSFTVIWTATVVANIGTWMYNAATGWLMTSLSADPLVVSLVQVAASLPMCLFAVPAGALADIVDKRRFLVLGESRHDAVVGDICWARFAQSGHFWYIITV